MLLICTIVPRMPECSSTQPWLRGRERGEEIARKLVGVGAMLPDEQRTFTLSVEMNPASAGGKRTWH